MMTERESIKDSAELFHRINRLSAEAEWTTEELRQELREGGVDPDQLVRGAREKVEQLRKNSSDDTRAAGASSSSAEHQSVLAELRTRTNSPASRIAQEMDVPVPFLSAVGRYPKAVPVSWRRELAARAERKLNIPAADVMRAFEHPYQAQMAASRDSSYEAEEMTPEKILNQSGMGEETKRYWLSLATKG